MSSWAWFSAVLASALTGFTQPTFGQADRRIVYSIEIDPDCGKSSQNAKQQQMMMRYP